VTLPPLGSGQTVCFDENGVPVPCPGSGQDAEFQRPPPSSGERFRPTDALVHDTSTGLTWSRSANVLGFPQTWPEALLAVANLNQTGFLGHGDWRLPNWRELRSLISHGQSRPALPKGHPFTEVFLGWYWTSTTKAEMPAYAWNVHLEGGRMFYSRKDEFRLLWPVRGSSHTLPQTGQSTCFDAAGSPLPCLGTGQDGDLRCGLAWPSPRFARTPTGVLDLLTGLCWMPPAERPAQTCTWQEALTLLGPSSTASNPVWRLPSITELESLVDAAQANPALPPAIAEELGEMASGDGFWSSTSSGYDPAWAYVLYVQKGAVGVGFKPGREFRVWPVRRDSA